MTPKQQRFVEEYLIDLNATQAAIRAGYSAKTASSQGERLLRNADIQKAVTEAKQARSEKTGIDAAWVLARLGHELTADLADLYDEQGALKPVHEWPLIWRQGLIAGVETDEERDDDGKVIAIVRKVKLSDRVKRLELAGKHVDVQAFKDKIEQSGVMVLNILDEDAVL
ncbi:phage terminase small subunit [Sphingobium jiangsuense]|uniref:Phage terminase small subunit n=2 Tax=Sphingobium jiangsuense TaxID=870476 RepID=A0A7W6BKV1_9SPHN|nr:terminase small subunit [Sphingobium jiangsuense]MBB3928788.1 phage terminase small subunit [Sphingobium jiangsuense]